MEDREHFLQIQILGESLIHYWINRHDFVVGGNQFLYYDETDHRRNLGPDFYVSVGVEDGIRKSWVVWEEGTPPNLVIEFLSVSTAHRDKGPKLKIYESDIKVPEYYLYDTTGREEFLGYHLGADGKYVPVRPDADGRLTTLLGLKLGISPEDAVEKYKGPWLRWFTADGELLPTQVELRQQESARANQAQRDAKTHERTAAKAIRERDGAIGKAQRAVSDAQLAVSDAQRTAGDALRVAEEAKRERDEAVRLADSQAREIAELKAQLRKQKQ